MTQAVVIGAGPAGLMAAETLRKAGVSVLVADAMPSVGRKFLMAGKSGLNLTKNESLDSFLRAYGPDCPDQVLSALQKFGPQETWDWAEGLGQTLFTGSTGRVFPTAMKASPLLRAWLARLADYSVEIRTHWRWTGWHQGQPHFSTPDGDTSTKADVVILALGGASWARLGSDGAWAKHFPDDVTPFAPANMGFAVDWSNHMQPFFGQPVKGTALIVGGQQHRGEFVITQTGVEGGGIYQVSRDLRVGATLALDLLPDWSIDKIATALNKPRGRNSQSNHLRKVLGLGRVKLALLNEFGRPFPNDLAGLIKALPVPLADPMEMNGAISTAGGLKMAAINDALMLTSKPGVFCAGEMLDWEAPTGGYLITACLATGEAAGLGAMAWLKTMP